MWHLSCVALFSPLINIPEPIPEPLTPWDYLDQNMAVSLQLQHKLQQSFLFSKERFVTRIICWYQVSGLHVHSESLKKPHRKRKLLGERRTKREKHHIRNRLRNTPLWFLFFGGRRKASVSYSLPFSTRGTRSLSFCQRYLHLFNQKTKHKLACLSSFALHNTCKIIIKMRSVTHGSWPAY